MERNYMPVAVHMFFVKDGRVLMHQRQNTGYEDGNYSVVAGHVDAGESITDAAVREALEEAGVHIDKADIQPVGVMHRKSNDERIDYFVTVSSWKGEITNQEPHKCGCLKFVSMSNLPPNTISYIRQALLNWQSGVWFSEFGWD